MKTAFIIALLASGSAITLAAGGSPKSGNSETPLTHESAVKDEDKKPLPFYSWVQKTLPCPEFVQTDEATNRVELWIKVSQDGTVEVEDLFSYNTELSNYVKTQLDGKVYPSTNGNNEYHFTIHFRRIS